MDWSLVRSPIGQPRRVRAKAHADATGQPYFDSCAIEVFRNLDLNEASTRGSRSPRLQPPADAPVAQIALPAKGRAALAIRSQFFQNYSSRLIGVSLHSNKIAAIHRNVYKVDFEVLTLQRLKFA